MSKRTVSAKGGAISKRIFVAGISQESNSFNPLKSTYKDFTIYKGQEFRDMPGVAVMINAGYDVTESVWARAVPAGTLKFDDFMRITDEILKPLREDSGKFDGVLLPMHGALDVEFIGSGEAFIANRIRDIVGPWVPISAALDMHATITYGLADTCNIIYGFRTAPHIDVNETHVRAAELLMRAIEENVLPRTEILRIPYIMPGENMMTESGIGKEIIASLPAIEDNKNTWCASYFVGMVWIDCPQNGAAVVISGVGCMDRGKEKATRLAKFVWDNRKRFEYQGLAMEPEDAIGFAKEHMSDGLVIVSDSADNVTAGAAADNAYLFNMFLEKGVENALFAAIFDPQAVKVCSGKKVGDRLDIEIAGGYDKDSEKAKLNGAEIIKLTLDLEVENPKTIAEDKPSSCVLRYKGIDVILFNKRKPVFTEETLNEHGVSMNDYNILVVKQGYLSPELNEATNHAVMALTPGNCSQKVDKISYKKIRRPIYPLNSAGEVSKIIEQNISNYLKDRSKE